MTSLPNGLGKRASEDWLAVWLGAALVVLVLIGVRPVMPAFSWGPAGPGDVFAPGSVAAALLVGIMLMVGSAGGVRLMGRSVGAYAAGFPAVFLLAWTSRFVAGNAVLKQWGSATSSWRC